VAGTLLQCERRGPDTMAEGDSRRRSGGTKIQAGGRVRRIVVGQSRCATPKTDAGDVMAGIVASIRAALDTAGKGPSDLRAIGIGTPGSVDAATAWCRRLRMSLDSWMTCRSARPSARLSRAPVSPSTTTYGPPSWASTGMAPAAHTGTFSACSSATGVGGGLILEGELRHRPGERRRDRSHDGQTRRPPMQLSPSGLPRGVRRTRVH